MRAETKFNHCHWTLMLSPWLLISNHFQQISQHSNTPKLKLSATRSTSLPVLCRTFSPKRV
jgi:hypothetical protein